MKSFISIIAFAMASAVAASPSGLKSRQFDDTCQQESGGPSGDAKRAVTDLLKQHLPLDVGGSDGWGQPGPVFRATCQGAAIWVQHTGWEGAERSLTAGDLDAVMDKFGEGPNGCSAAVDGSAGYLAVLYATEGFFSGGADFEYTC